jgi:hypothetical protein
MEIAQTIGDETMRWQCGLLPAALVALFACEDTITPPIVTSVLVLTGTRLFINQEVQLQAVPRDQQGGFMHGVACRWSSSDPTVASVAETGTVTGVSAGSVTITATCDEVSGSAQVDVRGLVLEQLNSGAEDSGKALHGSWGSSATDVFAVGGYEFCFDSSAASCFSYPIILHYTETGWAVMPPPEDTESLVGVWGSTANDVFAVGKAGTILHYDGATWTKMRDGEDLGAVWGSSAEDVFAAGEGILHYDGQTWSAASIPEESAFLNGIWGSSGTDVFAVGLLGTILHYDGHDWTRMPAPVSDERLQAVWGTSGNNVFAVGRGGTVLRYDGVAWSKVPVPTTNDLTGVWGPSASDVYVIGAAGAFYIAGGPSEILHYDETGWEVAESEIPQSLFGLWGTAEDVLLVGVGPTVLRLRR